MNRSDLFGRHYRREAPMLHAIGHAALCGSGAVIAALQLSRGSVLGGMLALGLVAVGISMIAFDVRAAYFCGQLDAAEALSE